MTVTDAATPAELRGKRRRGQAARAEPDLPRAGDHDAIQTPLTGSSLGGVGVFFRGAYLQPCARGGSS